MELRQLEIFNESALRLNFTQTAEAMGYAQSNVTKQIKSLERELGVALFERLGKKVFLTPEGKVFHEHVQNILLAVENARDAVNPSNFKGVLHIGAAESICVNWLPQIFQRYARKYPEVDFQLRMDSCYKLADLLRDNQIDVALALAGKIDEPDMIVKILHEEPMCLVANPLSSLAQLDSITPFDFRDVCLILTTEGCGYRPLILDMLHRYRVKPARRMELASVAAIKACVMANMGAAILPEISVAHEIQKGDLVKIDMAFETFHVYSQIFYHKNKWQSPALTRFIDTCR